MAAFCRDAAEKNDPLLPSLPSVKNPSFLFLVSLCGLCVRLDALEDPIACGRESSC
jgi:hypothetical protein